MDKLVFKKKKRKKKKLKVLQRSPLCHSAVLRFMSRRRAANSDARRHHTAFPFFPLGFVVGAVLLSETIHPNDPLKFKGNYSNGTSSTGEKVATCHPVDMKALSVFAQRTLIAPCFFVVEISLAN